MRADRWLGFALMALFVGCEAAPSSSAPEQAATPPAETAATDSVATATDPAATTPSSYAPTGETNPYSAPPVVEESADSPPAEPSPLEQPPAEQPTVREVAEPGVGVRGATLEHNIIQGPAKAYFQVRERTAFLQVEQALNLFRGLEGRLPQSHEEFMEKVIQANGIQLPELPAGARYVWDPQKGELMVERPRP